jgi:hypothetical protein
MLTLPELQILIPLLDAGIKATGLQLFQQRDGGMHLQSALAKLQAMADEAQKQPETKPDGKLPNG